MFREKIRPQVFSGFTDSKGNFRKFTVSGYRTFQVGSESALIANAQSPVELLVMDPIGRLVGFEPRTGINYNEITGASYFQDDPLVDDTDDGPNTGDPTGIKSVYIPSPLAGTYQVMVTGTGNGLYTIDLQTSGPDVVGQAANYSGTAAVGVQFTNYFTVLPTQISIVQNGGFETGDFTGWTLSGSDTNDIFIDDGSQTGIVPHSGNYLAALAPVGSFSYLSQTLATIAGVGYSLSLWLNSPNGLTPNKFLVSWNGNALFDQTNLPAIGWTNMQFTVTATGSSTVLQFGSQDDNRILGLD